MCMYIYTYVYIKQFLFLFLFKREVLLYILSWPQTPYVVQVILEHMAILLPQPPECWNYRLEQKGYHCAVQGHLKFKIPCLSLSDVGIKGLHHQAWFGE